MQGAGPSDGHNPFGPVVQGAYVPYNVNTTAQFADEVVPAIPQGPPPSTSFSASHQGAWGAPAPHGAYGPQHVALQFTDTTAPQYVTGNIQRQEERQNLVGFQGRSDDPAAAASIPGIPGAPFSQLPPQVPASGGDAGGSSGNAGSKEDYTKYPFYNVRRYREYFDVDTKDVLWRVGNSLIGVFRPNFMEVTMKNPDLYGPFWTATTLVFVTAVVGNFVDYIQWWKDSKTPSPPPPPVVGRLLLSSSSELANKQWFTDYTKLATSAAIFYGYIFVVGLILFFFVKWFKGELRLANVFCIYGYCLTIYVPVSIACMVPIDWVRWLLVMSATALSAGFLFMNFRATIYSAAPARAMLVLLLIVLAHIGLGLGLKLYFFQY
ncbi:hypothetical protein Vretimale_920 [Volvox reticuliferus]|uniref:Protein YIP n=1 Tax=Volvox reticuliferus TaxID=1737510 RepID=A0A8J4BY81_9CHLO|nr:hypothetical protein Vretifemale_2157 [Volvox reticuliferus]GIL94700.1 hypothetical protein Vretimale_920 [Volvox reticuliferus]